MPLRLGHLFYVNEHRNMFIPCDPACVAVCLNELFIVPAIHHDDFIPFF